MDREPKRTVGSSRSDEEEEQPEESPDVRRHDSGIVKRTLPSPELRAGVRLAPDVASEFARVIAGLLGAAGIEISDRYQEGSTVDVVVVGGPNAGEAVRKMVSAGPMVAVCVDDGASEAELMAAGANDAVWLGAGERAIEASVRTAARRHIKPGKSVSVGELTIDWGAPEVRVAGQVVDLTECQLAYLCFLAQRQGKWFKARALQAGVRGTHHRDSSAVRVHVHEIRARLGDEDGEWVESKKGFGYRLAPSW